MVLAGAQAPEANAYEFHGDTVVKMLDDLCHKLQDQKLEIDVVCKASASTADHDSSERHLADNDYGEDGPIDGETIVHEDDGKGLGSEFWDSNDVSPHDVYSDTSFDDAFDE